MFGRGRRDMFRTCRAGGEAAVEDASMVVNILLWCLFGLVAGAIAQFIMPGKDPGQSGGIKGLAITAAIGLIGAVVGGLICKPIFGWDDTGFNWQTLLVAVGGALILLLLYRLVMSAASKA